MSKTKPLQTPSDRLIASEGNLLTVFFTAVLIFEAGSVVCAAARSSAIFIVGRAISGCGAAGVYAGVLTMVAQAAPMEKRPIYLASVISMFALAAIVGPLIGGALTDRVSWRWCFWINPFCGGVSAVVVFFGFSSFQQKKSTLRLQQKLRDVDVSGSVSLNWIRARLK